MVMQANANTFNYLNLHTERASRSLSGLLLAYHYPGENSDFEIHLFSTEIKGSQLNNMFEMRHTFLEQYLATYVI